MSIPNYQPPRRASMSAGVVNPTPRRFEPYRDPVPNYKPASRWAAQRAAKSHTTDKAPNGTALWARVRVWNPLSGRNIGA